MVRNRIGQLFLCVDGNFDVVASKRIGRVTMPTSEISSPVLGVDG